ncbi:LamG domain protein jellyroll fold domain protein, partial [Candidatus Thiomargarita nelsonii]
MADLSDGLVAYYPFDGNAQDASGNGNHGTVNGATLTEDRFGNPESAYSFNGINNYIDLGNVIATNVFSFSVWFTTNSSKRNQTILGNYRPCSYVDTGFILINYGREIESGGPRLQLNKNAALDYSEDIADNRWHHVVGVFGNNSFYFYVDGILRGSETGSYNQTSINTKVGAADAISGGCGVTGESYFNGKIDDIRIYNRVLSKSEIQQLYKMDNKPSDNCWATYENGNLHIPCLKVKGPFDEDLHYEADMQYEPLSEPMTFQVTGVKPK